MGAWAQGWDLGSQAAKTQGDHSRALSDEEHEQALGTYNNTIGALQQKMSQVGPNDPSYGDLQNQLSQTLDARTSLFHPNRPGGLARLGAMVFGAMQKHPPAPKMGTVAAPVATPAAVVPETAAAGPYTNELGDTVTPASLRQRFAGTNELGAPLPAAEVQAPPPATAAPVANLSPLAQAAIAGVPTRQNPLMQSYRDAVEAGTKAGLSPEQAQEAAQTQLKISLGVQAKPVSRLDRLIPLGKPVADGQGGFVQPMRHADGTISNQPLPSGWTPPGATPSNSALAVQRREYAKARGIDEKDLTFDDELNIAATLAQAKAGTTSATHTTFQTINGQVTPIQETTTSGKTFNVKPITKVAKTTAPPADQTSVPASALKTPGTLKKQVAAASTTTPPSNNGMGIKVGQPLGEKPTGAQTKADEAYNDATKLNALADNVVKTKEPGQQKQLALALIKAMAGRVNMQEYSIYTKGYGVPNTIAGLVQGIENGGLAPGVVDQLVKSAKANLMGARAAQVQSRKAFKPDDGPSVDDVLKALKGGG